MRLATLTVEILALAALFPAAGLADPGRTMRFEVVRNGKQIGTNTIQLHRSGAETAVRIITHVEVKIAFLTAYRFDQAETERWVDGRLVALQSSTDDNGTMHRVSATSAHNKITVEADGKTTEVAGSTIPASLWNPALLDRTMALNPQDGAIMPIAVVDHGVEPLVVQGDEKRVHHYSITSTFPQDVWYDDARQLVKVQMKGPDGSIIQYQPG